MDLILLFAITGVVIFIGFLGELVFDKTRIPDVIWLMLFGVVIGRLFDVAEIEAFQAVAPIFTTFALIFLLFEGVLNINLKELMTGAIEGGSLSFLNFIFTMVFISLIMRAFGWSILEGLLLGAMLGDSSQAVIIPLIKHIRIKSQTALALTFESAISDVFCIIGALAVLNVIVLQTFSFNLVLQKIIFSFTFAVIIGIISGFIWTKIVHHMDRFSKSYITTIGALLLLYSAVEYFEANGPLACLAFGIVVGNSKKIASFFKKETEYNMSSSAKFFFSEISFFLKTFFFVYLGLIINLSETRLIILGFFLALALFMIRPLSVRISHRNMKLEDRERTLLEIMNPKGLSAAVLAQLPVQFGLPHGKDFYTLVMSAIISSVLLSIITLFLTEKGYFKGVWAIIPISRLSKRNSAAKPN